MDQALIVEIGQRFSRWHQHGVGFGRSQCALRNYLGKILFGVFGDHEYEIGAGQPAAATVKDSNEMRMRQLCRAPPGGNLGIGIARRGANQLDRGFGCAAGDAGKEYGLLLRSSEILFERKSPVNDLALPLRREIRQPARVRYCLHKPAL
jgi:hypothetical protein